MSLYLALARMAFQRQLAYRAANLAGMVTNGFFGAVRAFLLIALFRGRADVAGWSVLDAVTFVALTQALAMVVSMWGNNELAQSIISGEVVSDLSKPFDYYLFWLARYVGRSIYYVVFRAVPTFVLIWLFFRVYIPTDPLQWLTFGAVLLGAILVSFSIHFLVSAVGFWTLDTRGVAGLTGMLALLLSGFLVPLAFFPSWLGAIARALPWAGMVQLPVDAYLGKVAGPNALAALAWQLAWFAALMLAGRGLVRLMLRRLVVQGG